MALYYYYDVATFDHSFTGVNVGVFSVCMSNLLCIVLLFCVHCFFYLTICNFVYIRCVFVYSNV